MALDWNVIATENHMAQEAEIGPFLGALEASLETMDEAHRLHTNARADLTALYEKLMQHFLPIGSVLDVNVSAGQPYLSQFSILTGNARRARRFQIASVVTVEVHASGDPELSRWQCIALPLSPTTGKPMSAATSNGVGTNLRIGGYVWAHPERFAEKQLDQQHIRDDFLRFAFRAEAAMQAAAEAEHQG